MLLIKERALLNVMLAGRHSRVRDAVNPLKVTQLLRRRRETVQTEIAFGELLRNVAELPLVDVVK